MFEIISRSDAIARGLTNYFTGRPCKRGHVAQRNVKNKGCHDCHKLTIARHIEKVGGEEVFRRKEADRTLRYIAKDPERRRVQMKRAQAKAYALDPQKFIAKAAKEKERLLEVDPIRLRLSEAARRAAYRVRTLGEVSERGLTAVVRRIWDRCGGQCEACGSDDRLHLDHIVPLAKGGTNAESNLQFLCQTCNFSKNDSDYDEWLERQTRPEGIAA